MDYLNCFLLLEGFYLAFSYDDLSYQKFATQLPNTGSSTGANDAVDRNSITCMKTADIGLTSEYKTVWWKVDLGGVYNIYSINMLFRNYEGQENRQRGRFAGFSLYVSSNGEIPGSTLCYKDRLYLPPLNFTTLCTEYGRYIIFYNERLDIATYPTGYELTNVFTELCEVVVLGCGKPDVYGRQCDLQCPLNCKYNICHIQYGTCFACDPGWTGTRCTEKCRDGWFGKNCTEPCASNCKENAACNHVTGLCDRGCAAGWIGPSCDRECDDGTFGNNCIHRCSDHCLSDSPCNKQTGQCVGGCDPGYTTSDCSQACPSGYFGLDCKERCSGHCMNDEPCNYVSGNCSNGCHDGYLGTRCNTSCMEGYYGTDCSLRCSPNCKICQNTDGMCACKSGWMGQQCLTECALSYGENCQYPCSVHCINKVCDRFNGTCLFGCAKGESCDREIPRNDETTDVPGPTWWIIAFALSFVINIIFIIHTTIRLIKQWKISLRKQPKSRGVLSYWRSTFRTKQIETVGDVSLF